MMLDVHDESGRHLVATVADTLLLYYRERIDLVAVRATRPASQHLHERFDRWRVIAVVEEGTALPENEVRVESARIHREYMGDVCAHATVLYGSGFWAAGARAALQTVFMLSASSHPRRVFPDAEHALAWLAGFGRQAHGQDEILAWLHKTRTPLRVTA